MSNHAPAAKYDPGYKKSISNKWAKLEGRMIHSLAYRKLSGSAIRVLNHFMLKRRWDPKSKKGNPKYIDEGLKFPYGEAKRELGIKYPSTFSDLIQRLVEVGFIDIESRGDALISKATVYRLSDRWMKYGTPGFVPKPYEKQPTRTGFDAQKREREKILTTKNRSGPTTKNRSDSLKVTQFPATKNRSEKMQPIGSVILEDTGS